MFVLGGSYRFPEEEPAVAVRIEGFLDISLLRFSTLPDGVRHPYLQNTFSLFLQEAFSNTLLMTAFCSGCPVLVSSFFYIRETNKKNDEKDNGTQ